jgi:hypothetical protein
MDESYDIKRLNKRKIRYSSDGDLLEDPIEDSDADDDSLLREIEESWKPLTLRNVNSIFSNMSDQDRSVVTREIKQVEDHYFEAINDIEAEINSHRESIKNLSKRIGQLKRNKTNEIEAIKNKRKSHESSNTDEYRPSSLSCKPILIKKEPNGNEIYSIRINQNYFNHQSTYTCTSISMMCIVNFLYEGQHPLQFNWYETLKQGAELWAKWKSRTSVKTDFQYTVEVFNLEELSTKRDKLEYSEIAGRVIRQNHSEESEELLSEKSALIFRDAIDLLDSTQEQDFAISLTIEVYTITLFYISETDKWILYDSHAPNEKSRSSSLIIFPTKENVDAYITLKYAPKEFDQKTMTYKRVDRLFSMCVFTKKNITN